MLFLNALALMVVITFPNGIVPSLHNPGNGKRTLCHDPMLSMLFLLFPPPSYVTLHTSCALYLRTSPLITRKAWAHHILSAWFTEVPQRPSASI